MKSPKSIFIVISVLIVLAVGALVIYVLRAYPPGSFPTPSRPTSFEECAKAGHPIMESYPRQCRTPDGQLFVEKTTPPTPPPGEESPTEKCVVVGCSGTICTSSDNA